MVQYVFVILMTLHTSMAGGFGFRGEHHLAGHRIFLVIIWSHFLYMIIIFGGGGYLVERGNPLKETIYMS